MRWRREWKKIEGKAASPQPSPKGEGATDIAEALLVKVRPEAGFTHDGVVIHYGPADKRREVHLPAHKVKSNGMLKISRKYMVGEVEIEGLFVEVMGNR